MMNVSCTDNQTITFNIINKSSRSIDKIEISILGGLNKKVDSITLYDMQSNEEKILKWDVDDIVESDGQFLIKIKSEGIKREHGFGYFSNGYHYYKHYQINIMEDNIEISKS